MTAGKSNYSISIKTFIGKSIILFVDGIQPIDLLNTQSKEFKAVITYVGGQLFDTIDTKRNMNRQFVLKKLLL